MRKVLYAEDEYANRKLLEMLLEQRGVECDLAEDGVTALEEAGFDKVFLKPMRGPEYTHTIMSHLEETQSGKPRRAEG